MFLLFRNSIHETDGVHDILLYRHIGHKFLDYWVFDSEINSQFSVRLGTIRTKRSVPDEDGISKLKERGTR